MWRQVNRQVELLLLINVVCANVVHGAPRRRSQGSPHDGADTTHVVRGTEPSGCTTAHAHRRQLQTWSRTHFEAGGEHETKRIAFLFLHPVIHEELWGRFLDGYDTRCVASKAILLAFGCWQRPRVKVSEYSGGVQVLSVRAHGARLHVEIHIVRW
jgi:hypothetical protein